MRRVVTATMFPLLLVACQVAPKSEGGRARLERQAEGTMALFEQEDPGLEAFFDTAAGWAVFPSVGKGALIVGGAHGQGVLYEGGRRSGYCSLSQGSVGASIGGQSYMEIIFFQTPAALQRFKSGTFALAAQASAVAVESGAAAAADYENGVAIFTMAGGGLMLEASVGGQQFDFRPL